MILLCYLTPPPTPSSFSSAGHCDCGRAGLSYQRPGLLAVVHALRVFLHYLLGSGAPRPNGVHSDFVEFVLRTDRTIRGSHRSAPNGTSIDSSPAGWMKLKSFALMSSTYQENSIQPTLSLGAAFGLNGSQCWTLVRSLSQDPRRYKNKMRFWPPLRPAQCPPQLPAPTPSQRWQGLRSSCCWAPGDFPVPSDLSNSSPEFLAQDFVATWQREIVTDQFFSSILKGATVTATVGGLVDTKGRADRPAASRPAFGTFMIRCGLLYRREQGEADRSCIPDGGNLRQRIISECHDTPLEGHFGRHNIRVLDTL
jgi:hypothetical protein